MKNLIKTEVDTPDGVGLLEQIYVTELGHVMLRIYYKKKRIWVNKRITSLESFLEGTGINCKGGQKIKKYKGRRSYQIGTYG